MVQLIIINKRYDPHSIDDPFTYRVRDGFMSIGDLWAGGGGTVYLQGHPVIPNPWGDAVTNGTTTTTTDDTTDKDGGDGCGNKLCDSAPYSTNPCKNGVGVTYNFSYTSIDIIDVKVDEEGNIVSTLTGLNQRAQQRLIDAGFSKEQRAMVGVALENCYFDKGGTMLGCTSKICSDGTCGFSCNCNDNRNTNYDTCDMCL